MVIISTGLFVIIFLSVSSGILLKFSDKTLEKYQNKLLLKIVIVINQICSSMILIPLQISLGFLVILLVLVVLFLIVEKLFIINELTILFSFSIWLVSMQSYMKYLWRVIEYIANRYNENLKIPKKISDFIGNIFYGKVLIYIVALIFVIINNSNVDINNEIIIELRKILNSAILVFIAVDRIIVSIQNWFKNNKRKNNCA
jgi:hypothetical protein